MSLSQGFEEKTIYINGLETNYKVTGHGPVFLILHGWGGSSNSWIKPIDILKNAGFTIIVPDFPGFGKTKTPSKPWVLDNFVEWLNNFIRELDIKDKFFLLGHSFGGRVAIKFSVKHPEKIRKLILCASAGIKPDQNFEKRIFRYLAQAGEYLFSQRPLRRFKDSARNSFYQIIRQKDYLEAKGTMKETIKKIITEDLREYLPLIKHETLLLWGKIDKLVPIKYGYVMAENIPNSKMLIFPDMGHAPNLEAPEKMTEEILRFINN